MRARGSREGAATGEGVRESERVAWSWSVEATSHVVCVVGNIIFPQNSSMNFMMKLSRPFYSNSEYLGE